MKILIDECVDQRLRLLLVGHDCQAAFEVMVTTDQEISFQQNLRIRRIAIIVLCAATNLRCLIG